MSHVPSHMHTLPHSEVCQIHWYIYVQSKDITALIEEKREEVVKMKDDLVTSAGVHSFPQHHYFLLTRVDNFLNSIEVYYLNSMENLISIEV